MKSRNRSIDFIKGVAISLMVFCHAIDSSYRDVRCIVALFDMSVFLMAAGWFFNGERLVHSWGSVNYVKGKVCRLWFPYVLWMSLFLLLHNWFLHIGIYTSDPEFLNVFHGRWASLMQECSLGWLFRKLGDTFIMVYREQLGGPMWFVTSLFWVYMIYGATEVILRKCRVSSLAGQTLIAITVLAIANKIQIPHIRYIGGMATVLCYALFHLGVLLRWYVSRPHYWHPSIRPGLVFSGCFVVLLGLKQVEALAVGACVYKCGATVVLAALAGWFMLLALAQLSERLTRLFDVVAYTGCHSFPILIFHMLAFRLVNILAVKVLGVPWCLVAGFPVAFEHSLWPVIYTAVGLVLPLAANAVFFYVLSVLCRNKKRDIG